MKTRSSKIWQIIFVLCVFVLVSGCSGSGQKAATDVGANKVQSSAPGVPAAGTVTNPVTENVKSGDIAVSVDGKVLKKADLDKDVQERFNLIKDKVQPDKQKDLK